MRCGARTGDRSLPGGIGNSVLVHFRLLALPLRPLSIELMRQRSTRVLGLLVAGMLVGLAWIGVTRWLGAPSGGATDRAVAPARTGPELRGDLANDDSRLAVEMRAASHREPNHNGAAAPASSAAIPAEKAPVEEQPPVPSGDHFPFGRPTPDWVFEQKYAGMPESEMELIEDSVEAAFQLVQKKAVRERFDAGDYEVIPDGESSGNKTDPTDDRIIAGRVPANSTEHQVVRLEVDKYPEVYELFYEYLWLKSRKR